MDYNLAPICLFTYNRLFETKKTVEALQQNFLATQSELFIFSDGSKTTQGKEKIQQVRNYLKTITGFKAVTIIESETNKGLANSIISGVTEIINTFEKVIVLEDDLITSPNFLDFMNQALIFYQNNNKIHSISGFSFLLRSLYSLKKDFYLGYRASSWGWGSWLKNWKEIDWEVNDYDNFEKSFTKKKSFRRGGSDLPRMLKNQMKGKIDSWAIRWCFHQFQKNQYTVHPTKSKIMSIGFSSEATHTKKTKRFNTILDESNKRNFLFDSAIEINKKLAYEHRIKFSIWARLMDKI